MSASLLDILTPPYSGQQISGTHWDYFRWDDYGANQHAVFKQFVGGLTADLASFNEQMMTLGVDVGQHSTPTADRNAVVNRYAGGFSDLGADIDIDSDNDNGFEPPERNFEEEEHEASKDKPGKIIAVNNDDSDWDNVPDWADGFDRFAFTAHDNNTTHEKFVPIVLEVPAELDLSVATFQISYSGSDPANVSDYLFPPAGKLLLWTKDGSSPRKSTAFAAVASPDPSLGYYVAPLSGADSYTSSDWAKLGITSSNRIVTLWVEAIAPSANKGDQRIEFKIDVDGDANGSNFGRVDSASVTPVEVRVTKTWSDRKVGVVANYLPGGTGYEGPDPANADFITMMPYILTGTRADNRLYIKSEFTITPDVPEVRGKILFRLIRDLA